MEKTLQIDGREVRFVSNGATMLAYRELFNRKFFADEQFLLTKAQNNDIDDDAIEVLQMLAYTLAKQGKSTTDTFEEWLSQFEIMSLLEAMPEIITLLVKSTTGSQTAKKK